MARLRQCWLGRRSHWQRKIGKTRDLTIPRDTDHCFYWCRSRRSRRSWRRGRSLHRRHVQRSSSSQQRDPGSRSRDPAPFHPAHPEPVTGLATGTCAPSAICRVSLETWKFRTDSGKYGKVLEFVSHIFFKTWNFETDP